MKNNYVAFALIAILVLAFFLIRKDKSYVKIAGQNVEVEVADTQEEQELGLSGRKNLKENEGILFVFDAPGKYGFWMKDMNFSIDMIWLAEDAKVIYIKKDARPE